MQLTRQDEASQDEALVRSWRREQFRRLGFSHSEAELLASSNHVELAQVRRISALGCDRQLILRIVL
jgi:hypothetical protein